MKLVCAFCGFRNKPDLATCAQCGQSLADARHQKFHLPWASWVPAIPLAILCAWQFSKIQKATAALREENRERIAQIEIEHSAALKKLDADYARSDAEQEAKHQSVLRDTQIISGQKAAARHVLEWSRRQSHDPAFISSILERTLVEVEKLGKDPALTAEVSLRKVAEMVCPPGSRIEITPTGQRFAVRVAFRLSAMAPHEAGTATFHTSAEEMRRQIEEATARVMKDLFDYCGSRGIERISVSCNRAILSGSDDQPRLNMRSLYRASLDAAKVSQISNWRSLSLAQVKALLEVEHDITSRITIEHAGGGGLPLDPNEPLEF